MTQRTSTMSGSLHPSYIAQCTPSFAMLKDGTWLGRHLRLNAQFGSQCSTSIVRSRLHLERKIRLQCYVFSCVSSLACSTERSNDSNLNETFEYNPFALNFRDIQVLKLTIFKIASNCADVSELRRESYKTSYAWRPNWRLQKKFEPADYIPFVFSILRNPSRVLSTQGEKYVH